MEYHKQNRIIVEICAGISSGISEGFTHRAKVTEPIVSDPRIRNAQVESVIDPIIRVDG